MAWKAVRVVSTGEIVAHGWCEFDQAAYEAKYGAGNVQIEEHPGEQQALCAAFETKRADDEQAKKNACNALRTQFRAALKKLDPAITDAHLDEVIPLLS